MRRMHTWDVRGVAPAGRDLAIDQLDGGVLYRDGEVRNVQAAVPVRVVLVELANLIVLNEAALT